MNHNTPDAAELRAQRTADRIEQEIYLHETDVTRYDILSIIREEYADLEQARRELADMLDRFIFHMPNSALKDDARAVLNKWGKI